MTIGISGILGTKVKKMTGTNGTLGEVGVTPSGIKNGEMVENGDGAVSGIRVSGIKNNASKKDNR